MKEIDVIIVPGHVENGQAKAMLTEHFTLTADKPLMFEVEAGLTIELTAYGMIRITQHRGPKES